MAHKAQGTCPIAICAVVHKRAKDLGVSLNQAISICAAQVEVPEETVRKWVWPSKKAGRRERGFWEKVLGQLRAGAKAVRLHGIEHPLDDETHAELQAIVRFLGEFVIRAELEGGTTHLPEDDDAEPSENL